MRRPRAESLEPVFGNIGDKPAAVLNRSVHHDIASIDFDRQGKDGALLALYNEGCRLDVPGGHAVTAVELVTRGSRR